MPVPTDMIDLDQKLRDWLNDNGLNEYVSSNMFDNLYIYLYCSNEIHSISQFHNFLHGWQLEDL